MWCTCLFFNVAKHKERTRFEDNGENALTFESSSEMKFEYKLTLKAHIMVAHWGAIYNIFETINIHVCLKRISISSLVH